MAYIVYMVPCYTRKGDDGLIGEVYELTDGTFRVRYLCDDDVIPFFDNCVTKAEAIKKANDFVSGE